MNQSPLISIIIPTYNRVDLLTETLESVLVQNYTNWECLIIDDGSIDTTKDVVQRFIANDSRFYFYKRPSEFKPGGNGSRNYGFKLSEGEYIQWFDDDDIMLPNYLSSRMDAMDTSTNLCILSGKLVDINKNSIRDMKWSTEDSLYRQFVLKSSEILSQQVLFKRKFLEGKKLFNEELQRSQEAEFFSRLFFDINASEYIQISDIGFLYRQHQQTKSFNDKTYNSIYKQAHFLVHQTNWDQAMMINDKEIIWYSYKQIIKLLIEAARANDKKLIKSILEYLKARVKPILIFKIKSSLCLILLTKTQGYMFKSYLLNQRL